VFSRFPRTFLPLAFPTMPTTATLVGKKEEALNDAISIQVSSGKNVDSIQDRTCVLHKSFGILSAFFLYSSFPRALAPTPILPYLSDGTHDNNVQRIFGTLKFHLVLCPACSGT
jgi:hypothetical protein